MRIVTLAATAGAILSLAGCATPGLAPGQVFPVFFTSDAVTPDTAGQGVVTHAAGWARQYAGERIVVTGYADPDQPRPELDRLASQRAASVAAGLEAQGVSPSRVTLRIGRTGQISGLHNRRVDIAIGM